jgi:RimJ/RimL family protein N-acetyltransferase
VYSERLELIPLNSAQLRLYLERPSQLERELNISISRSIITDRVRRAIRTKLARMENLEEAKHLWLTYWLMVVRDIHFGAGLVGFKGPSSENGEVEIGYGIDPDHQRQGYTTEAVKRMVNWAFEEKDCISVVAIAVQKSNIASQRVLEKAGMTIYEESAETVSYRITREEII